MTTQKPSFFLAFLFWFLSIAQVFCAENPPVQVDFRAEIFSLHEGKGRLVFNIGLAKGWKIYAHPEAQDTLIYPPEISWDGSHNLKNAKLTWPYPEAHEENQQISHVYTQPFTVLLDITAQRPTQPLFLKGKLKILACSTQCLPLEIPFSLSLNQSVQAPALQEFVEATLANQELAEEGLSLPFILVLALAGGLILNVMPCVLPVLGLKLFFFSTHKTHQTRHLLRRNFLLTACGIYTSFSLLALAAIILKSLEEAVGWGLHFQNPYFLVAMIVSLSLFTANLWGIFDFHTPHWLNRFLKTKESLQGGVAFSSGILATLLATPCSAPFVGTAVGFALARAPLDIFLVFSALATGFSAPYFLALILPLDKIRLPKAGVWMVYVQYVLGLFLAGTVLWLFYLLEHHQTYAQFWGSLFFFGLGCLGLFLLPRHPQRGKRLSFICFFLLCLVPAAPPWFSSLPLIKEKWAKPSEKLYWHPLNTRSIDQWVRQGKTVFVDITASWCLTCHMNKHLVLENAVIQNRLNTPHLVPVRGDWSKSHPEIPSFLKKFGRAAIPFNMVIGPRAPQGIVLPEILTIEAVLHALHQASGF